MTALLAYSKTATPKEKYIAKSSGKAKRDGSKTAKLSQKLMFKLANGSIDITKSALQFMLYTINYVSKDGRIYTKMETMKNALNFQTKTLVRVIAELEELGLLSKEGQFLYSHFHVLSNGQKSDETYVRNIKTFTSPAVLNLKKNELRFFLYVASRGLMNKAAKLVAVESLYSNETHKGVNYIDSYQELVNILNTLVSKGLIDVFIGDQFFNQSNAAGFKMTFHNYCGYKENTRKKRMSKKSTHNIGLRVNPLLINKENIAENEASRKEIEYFATENGFFHSHLRPETIPTLISVQNTLFERFNLIGVEMYRQALVDFFTKEGDNVIYYDLYADDNGSKAVNVMMDFFLLPSIIKLISSASSTTTTENPIISYFHSKENLLALVDYFTEKASDNHCVLLDEALEAEGIQLTELIKTVEPLNPTENSWLLLQAQTKKIFKTVNYSENVLSPEFQKRIIRQWAKEGLFTQKVLLDETVQSFKSKVVFLPKEEYRTALAELKPNEHATNNNNKAPSERKKTSDEKMKRLRDEYSKKETEPIIVDF